MATQHSAKDYSVGGRVVVTLKNGEELKALVKKIIGGENDLLLVVPENEEEDGTDERKVRASRVRKARGPKPGSTRTPKSVPQTSKEVEEDDTEEDEAESSEIDVATFKEMSNALEQMKALIDGHIAFLNENSKPAAKVSALAIGKNKNKSKVSSRPLAEDEDE